MTPEVKNGREPSAQNSIDVVGGKAFNLYRLAELSQGRDFEVPDFRVITVGAHIGQSQLEELFESLPKPLAVRSSSPWEDSEGLSFAGRFTSVLGVVDFPSLQRAVQEVLASATDSRVSDYARQHGVTVDNRMAVIVQEMVDPLYSGVCYSTVDPRKPRLIAEFTGGLSDELMSGDKQGSLASFDPDFHLTMEFGNELPGLERVARVAKDLESVFGERLDIEFAVAKDGRVFILQARQITDPVWSEVQIPEIEESQVFLQADIVTGSGSFTGEVFVFRSPTELQRYAQAHNRRPMAETHEQWRKLREFNRSHSDGYCLIADNLEAHEIILKDEGLSNLRALVTVDYASRFSHPAKAISETGAFYLGVLGKKGVLDLIDTGDTLTVASDQLRGVAYGLTKPVVEQRRVDLEGISVVQYQEALGMRLPPYEEIDDKLFVDKTGKVGVVFWDYYEEGGIPTDVFYNIVDAEGNVINKGEYRAGQVLRRFSDFPSLLASLLSQVGSKS